MSHLSQSPCRRCAAPENVATPFCAWCGRRVLGDPPHKEDRQNPAEQFFRKLVSHCFDGIGLYAADTTMLYLTPSVRRMSGYEIEEMLGKRAIEFAHPDDVEACAKLWDRLLQDPAEVGRLQFRARRKDGSYCHLEMTVVNRLHDPDVQAVVANLRDVTEDVRKAEEQRCIQQRYDLVIGAAQEGIWEIDVASNQVRVSERYRELTGYGPSDGPRSVDFWLSIIHPDHRELVAEALREHMTARKPYDVTFQLLTADRGYRWFHARGQAALDADGKPVRFAGSLADITEQCETRKALELSEERHSLMVRGVNDGIWDWDLVDPTKQYHSPRWYEIVGYTEADFPKDPAAYFALVHPDDRARVEEALRRNFERGERYALEIRLKHRDGHYLWVLTRGETVRDATGRPLRIVGSICDISERKQADEQVLSLQDQLAHVGRVGAMGEMAGGLAHELNQPLATIHLDAAAAENLLNAGKVAEALEVVRRIGAHALRTGEVIRRLRNFVRRNVGKTELVDVCTLIQDALPLVEHEFRRHSIHVTFHPREVAKIYADGIQVQQVVLNLVKNAIEAMTESDQLRVLTIDVSGDSQSVAVTVRDTGPGLAVEIRDKLFTPFQTTKTEGLGLGLAICRSIIESHGGRISAMPNEGIGMSFSFVLPIRVPR
jgi:PAS domain S-box-containing protein